MPTFKRSETMPTPAAAPRESRGRKEGSRLRPEAAYPTPSPERETRPAESRPSKYSYGVEYADDAEYATPDGYRTADSHRKDTHRGEEYRTEERAPSGSRQRMTRSPDTMKDREGERQRSSSNRHATTTAAAPPPLPRTTSSTKYHYPGDLREESYSRPAVSRENSGRLYGELPRMTASPRQNYSPHSPPPERSSRQSYEEPKMHTGYTRRPEKPSNSRSSSWRQAVYA
jgi:hypothetical protein